jgi:hypothetical protein
MITTNDLTANINPNMSKEDKLFLILANLNADLAITIKDCECVSSRVLLEYQQAVSQALALLA